MTIELITGHAGGAHISSADDGQFNAGAFGDGQYVLDTGTHMACEVQSSNLVTVGVGDALFEGRHVRINATENVAIDNGAQGVNRNDIICIKYAYDSVTGIESAVLEVIKGTAAETATDPTIPSGNILESAATAYMPIWRIPITGITVGEPEQMFTILPSLHDVLDKTWAVSQIPNLPASKITSGSLPIARGGTGASSAAGALKNIVGAAKAVLYNNASGTTGTVTLSDSAANYDHMRVYATSPYGDVSVDIVNPNGKEFTMSAISTDNSGITTMYIVQQRRAISGTSMTVHDNGYTALASSSATNTPVAVSPNAHIKVIRVEAWKEA